MSDSLKKPSVNLQGKTNDHLANDRTFLAWIRTSLGIMGLGFIVVKFSMFLKQVSMMMGMSNTVPAQDRYSNMIGIFLVGFGALITLVSYLDYRRIRRQIDHNEFKRRGELMNFAVISLLIISGLLIWYLIEHSQSPA